MGQGERRQTWFIGAGFSFDLAMPHSKHVVSRKPSLVTNVMLDTLMRGMTRDGVAKAPVKQAPKRPPPKKPSPGGPAR